MRRRKSICEQTSLALNIYKSYGATIQCFTCKIKSTFLSTLTWIHLRVHNEFPLIMNKVNHSSVLSCLNATEKTTAGLIRLHIST